MMDRPERGLKAHQLDKPVSIAKYTAFITRIRIDKGQLNRVVQIATSRPTLRNERLMPTVWLGDTVGFAPSGFHSFAQPQTESSRLSRRPGIVDLPVQTEVEWAAGPG